MFRNSSGKTRWLLIFPALVLIILALVVARRIDKDDAGSSGAGTSPTRDAAALAESTVTVAGRDYTLDPEEEVALFIGVDDFGPAVATEFYYNEGQADFLMLCIINHRDGTYRMLHINRDSMTPVTMLGLGGKAAGKETMQIALAHCYGSGKEDSCENTVKAVSEFLYGIRIDRYLSMNMDAVGVLADAVGGVTLVCRDTFSDNPDFFEGNTVVLKGDDALTYVRGRTGVGDETNINRMERQKQFIEAFLDKFLTAAEDQSFSVKTLGDVSEYLVSDMTIQKMADMAELLSTYTCTGVYGLEGESVQGEEYMEFYPDTLNLQNQTIDLFCLPEE